MWGLLASGLGGLVKSVAPAAINWGMNKLMGSRVGRQYIAPAAALVSQFSSSPNESHE